MADNVKAGGLPVTHGVGIGTINELEKVLAKATSEGDVTCTIVVSDSNGTTNAHLTDGGNAHLELALPNNIIANSLKGTHSAKTIPVNEITIEKATARQKDNE